GLVQDADRQCAARSTRLNVRINPHEYAGTRRQGDSTTTRCTEQRTHIDSTHVMRHTYRDGIGAE
ncbi:MAG TPA: hypothetical protein VF510_16790, partial [Ktedonobacterales bacterium]